MSTTTSPSSSNNANGIVARRAAIAQLRSTSDKHANLINVAKCAGWAKRHGAQMLFLPECFGFMGESAEQTLKEADPPILSNNAAEFEDDNVGSWCPATTSFREILSQTIANAAAGGDDQDDDQFSVEIISAFSASSSLPTISIIDELRFIACKSKLWISGGGVHTKATMPQATTSTTATTTNPVAENKVYNTHVIINDRGQIQAHYHKIHLFDVSIPGKVELRESSTTSPGTKLVVCDSPIGKLGLSICYDMRFAEMYVEMVQKRGAQVLLMPSAFTVPTGKAHWHALLKARAIENQCYVIAAAQVGRHNEKRQSYGHSLVYDPWGESLADAGGNDGAGSHGTVAGKTCNSPVYAPSLIIADIDLNKVEKVRQSMPMQIHRNEFRFSD
ncbi:hypothetical protein ACHAWU_005758 [Discostella pseudostelligera]|uniref:CN hydrolase domain-containing protein n=1 Tax=Discostella pseudostelligera TaxID=259834 RepID=A0ABD3NAH5_9STRA